MEVIWEFMVTTTPNIVEPNMFNDFINFYKKVKNCLF